MRRAASRGVDVLALTDHDETSGLAEATEAAREAGIALVPNGQDQHGVRGLFEAVQRQVARAATRDDQFAEPSFRGAPDQGMVLENLHGLCNEACRRLGCHRIRRAKKVRQTLQVR